MPKGDLDAINEQISRLREELVSLRSQVHDARLQSAEKAPSRYTGKITDEYGNTYNYDETVISEGQAEARYHAKQLESRVVAVETRIKELKRKWSQLLYVAGYAVVWE